jgi:hypothetical protein
VLSGYIQRASLKAGKIPSSVWASTLRDVTPQDSWERSHLDLIGSFQDFDGFDTPDRILFGEEKPTTVAKSEETLWLVPLVGRLPTGRLEVSVELSELLAAVRSCGSELAIG